MAGHETFANVYIRHIFKREFLCCQSNITQNLTKSFFENMTIELGKSVFGQYPLLSGKITKILSK